MLRNLALNSAKAGATKVQLLDSANEMVRHRAYSFILGLVGISPEAAGASGGGGPADRGRLGHCRPRAGSTAGGRSSRLVIDVKPNPAGDARGMNSHG